MYNNNDNLPVRVAIIDDDAGSIDALAAALANYEDVKLCGTATNFADGERLLADTHPDLLFLDMVFPAGNGLEWYEEVLAQSTTKVVFYTCYKKYIHDALSNRVFDFLLKPIDGDDLTIILQRFMALRGETLPGERTAGIGGDACGSAGKKTIAITTITNDKVIVGPGDILYFRYESERKLWECVLRSMKRFILKRQTTADTILNYGPDFVRTHKKYIININYLGMVSGSDCRLLAPYDRIDEIKISKNYKRDLMDRFYDI